MENTEGSENGHALQPPLVQPRARYISTVNHDIQ